VIKFVADMNRAVKFYRDVLGLSLKFESPGWSEFITGETTLALHPASEKIPRESLNWASRSPASKKFHEAMSAKSVRFGMPPTKPDFGGLLAQFVDSEGGNCHFFSIPELQAVGSARYPASFRSGMPSIRRQS
jgi:catechol 2,3-dioxygenase-like lactoylglutathione lyase family enzyme